MAADDPVSLERRGALALLRLDRPEVHNAVDAATMAAFERHLDTLEAAPEVRAVVLTGAGERTFSAGGDLDYFAGLRERRQALEMSRRMQAILERLHGGPQPVIAAVQGSAWGGGCELLTACHLRLAAPHARFGFRQAAMGVVTGWGGGRRLFRLVGRANALRLLLTAETVGAEEALRLGLIDRICTGGPVLEEALELAAAIAEHDPAAIAGFLELARAVEERPAAEVAALESRLFADLWVGESFQTRMAERRRR